MSYILNQFNQSTIKNKDIMATENQVYMTPITEGNALRRNSGIDSGVSDSNNFSNLFYDECLKVELKFTPNINYYFHAKIKRLISNQVFNIYLVNYEENSQEYNKTQYLKTITVQGGDENSWVDFEIIFSPLINFDCILFQLERSIEDYRVSTRYPVIVYQELSKINNIITSKIKPDIGLIKMGIQSHSGLMMCINNEEIHIGRSGIYEIKNGIVTVDFLSIIFASFENINGNNPLRNPITNLPISLEDYLSYVASLPIVTSPVSTNSKCIFNTSKNRNIDSFTIDYMYKEE